MSKTSRLERIVLIHGAFHGAWCWDRLVPELVKYGYEVAVVDLPGSGDDPLPPKDVTFQGYIDRVVEVVEVGHSPVLLVGHSMGGMPISGVAEAVPDKIGKLIYLAALMPQDGENMFQASGAALAQSATYHNEIEGAIDFDLTAARDVFYHRCTAEVAAHATERLRPQAAGPFTTPISLTAERWGKVPKTYIVCEQDRALAPAHQHWLCSRDPQVRKRSLDTDHSPFYSDISAFAQILDEEARC